MISATILLDQLQTHPRNANHCTEETLEKIAHNIRRTGMYPPIVVRPYQGTYQILDGHHRKIVLERLNRQTAECCVWPAMDDRAAELALVTLNELRGKPDPKKRKALLADLAAVLDAPSLSALVPESQNDLLAIMGQTTSVLPERNTDAYTTRKFRLSESAALVVDMAIENVAARLEGEHREARALEMICADFCAGNQFGIR